MSLARHLFGDFSIVFRTPLSVPAAVGKLAAISDQSPFHADKPQLRGYATAGEIVLYEGGDFIFNPFRPHFLGSFADKQGVAVLSGTIRADWRVKLWCTVVVVASLSLLAFGSHDGLARSLAALAVGVAGFLFLRLSVRPTSGMVRSLTAKIERAIGSAES